MSATLLEFDWALPRGVHAAFTTRAGGVSAPPWNSFNVAAHVGDDPANIATNRARLRSLLSLPAEPAWLAQVHGVAVSDLGQAEGSTVPATADASFSCRAGQVCTVMVADCLPVLFASRDGQRIAAAHAGWRGLAAGVIEHTVRALGVPGAELTAWLGPAISREHFEVGDEVRAAFVEQDPSAAGAFTPNSRGRWQADLLLLARARLANLGITSVHGGKWCTFEDRDRFFSHRRDGAGGRMAALIWRT